MEHTSVVIFTSVEFFLDAILVEVEQRCDLRGHPKECQIGRAMLEIPAAAVTMDTGEPHLADLLLPRSFNEVLPGLPDRRVERAAPLVDRQRLEGVLDVCTEFDVEELVGTAARMHHSKRPTRRDAE